MLYSRDHVWIDERDPGNARVGITSYFSGRHNPVSIPAPVDFTVVSFRADITLRELLDYPESTGFIATVSCSDTSQFLGLMSPADYRDYCRGIDEEWNATNNPVRCPPDPYIAGQTFATIEGA